MKYAFLPTKIVFSLLLASIFLAQPVFAQGGDPRSLSDGLDRVGQIANENKLASQTSSKDILQSILKWILSFVGIIAVISLVYGGYLYITSQGDEPKAEQAKTIILYSVIGIIVIGLSAIVVNVVISVATGS